MVLHFACENNRLVAGPVQVVLFVNSRIHFSFLFDDTQTACLLACFYPNSTLSHPSGTASVNKLFCLQNTELIFRKASAIMFAYICKQKSASLFMLVRLAERSFAVRGSTSKHQTKVEVSRAEDRRENERRSVLANRIGSRKIDSECVRTSSVSVVKEQLNFKIN